MVLNMVDVVITLHISTVAAVEDIELDVPLIRNHSAER